MKLDPRKIVEPEEEPKIVSPSSPSGPEVGKMRLATPSSALNEFRVALDVWFPLMDEKTRIEAIQMADDWVPPPPRKRRPDGQG